MGDRKPGGCLAANRIRSFVGSRTVSVPPHKEDTKENVTETALTQLNKGVIVRGPAKSAPSRYPSSEPYEAQT